MAIVARGDKEMVGARRLLVQEAGHGGEVGIRVVEQVGARGPFVKVEALCVGRAQEQDEQGEKGIVELVAIEEREATQRFGEGEPRAAQEAGQLLQQQEQAERWQVEDKGDEADGAQIAGHDLAHGQRRGQQHERRREQQEQNRGLLPVVPPATPAPEEAEPADKAQPTPEPAKEGPAGQVEAPVGIAGQEKHAQRAQIAFAHAERGVRRNLTNAHPEGVGMTGEIEEQRRKDDQGSQSHDGELAEAPPAGGQHGRQRQQQRQGKEPGREVGVTGQAERQTGQQKPAPLRSLQATKEGGRRQRLPERLADGAEAQPAEDQVPEADGEQDGSQHSHAPVGQHGAPQPVCGGDGQQADNGGSQAQAEDGCAGQAHHAPRQVKEERLLARVAGDENGPGALVTDLGGQHAIRCFIVMEPRRRRGKAGQAQRRRRQQTDDHEGEGALT